MSPSKSDAIAVNENGVLAGMVTFPTVLAMIGALLVKGVLTGQVCEPFVMKFPISCNVFPWK